MTATETVTLHRVEVERDEDGSVTDVRFICDGGDDAPCHHYPDVQQRECWQEPWFNATTDSPLDFAELYDGPEDYEAVYPLDWLVSGYVDTTFEGDYMTWEYA